LAALVANWRGAPAATGTDPARVDFLRGLHPRHTDRRSTRCENFDIYLPLWLARHNKRIFGTLFVLSELFVAVRWIFRATQM